MAERKTVLLRLDAAIYDALARWANDELRSTNAEMEYLLRRALAEAGRLPENVGVMRRRTLPHDGPWDLSFKDFRETDCGGRDYRTAGC